MAAKTYHTLIIAMGSNYNQEAHIEEAKELLRATFKDVELSEPMWTEPIGLEGSDNFLNMVAVARTSYSKQFVEDALKYIEKKCGRKASSSHRGLIAMDLDLLRYGDEILRVDDWGRDYIKILMKKMFQVISHWDYLDNKKKNPNSELD